MLSFFYRSKTDEPYKARIAAFAIGIHVVFLISLLFFSSSPEKSKKKQLIVKTVMTKPPSKPGVKSVSTKPPSVAKATPPAPAKKETPVKKPEPVKASAPKPASYTYKKNSTCKNSRQNTNEGSRKKARTASNQVKKTPAPAKKTETKPPVVSQDLLQELEESIAKIDKKQDKIGPRKKLDTPKSIETLSVDNTTDLGLPDSN